VKFRRQIDIRDSFRYAGAGLAFAFTTQRNFRVHLLMGLAVAGLSAWLRLPVASWVLLVLTIGIVLVTEIFNTAAEVLVDLVSPDYHPLAKQVKDLAAGAVLLSAMMAVVVGLLILTPPLLSRLGLS
jgi:diacylglycerol kinase